MDLTNRDKNFINLYKYIALIPVIMLLSIICQIYIFMAFFISTKSVWLGSSIISGITIYLYIQIGFLIKKHYQLIKKN